MLMQVHDIYLFLSVPWRPLIVGETLVERYDSDAAKLFMCLIILWT